MSSRVGHRVARLFDMANRLGWWPTLRWAVRRVLKGPNKSASIDVLGHYAFVIPSEIPASSGEVVPKTLNWFVPDFNIGSGGHLNIFRTIWYLEQKGYTSHVVIVRPQQHQDVYAAEKEIREHFFPLKASVVLGLAGLPPCEFAVATGWDTAYAVRDFTGATHKVYFVQDYEPWFYSVGSESLLAENTYRLGLYGITAGGWLASKLSREFGMHTRSVGFGVEGERYKRLPRRESDVKRVFFYSRPPTARRAFELGLLVLNLVWQQYPHTQFILAGWDTGSYRIPFPHLACGTVSLEELPDLYSQCDVALVLSLTNLSLLPLELMACGCTVVSNRGPNVEWLIDNDVAALSEATPEALAHAIGELLADEERRKSLSRRGEEFARKFTWDTVADEFEAGLLDVRRQSTVRDAACVA